MNHRLSLLCCTLFVLFSGMLLSGCGPKKVVEEETKPPVMTPEERAAEDLKRREDRMRDALNKYKAFMVKNPDNYERNIRNFSDLLMGAEGLSKKPEIENTLASLKEEFKEYALEELEKIYPEVDKLVKEGDFVAAENILEKFDKRRYLVASYKFYDGEELEVLKELEEKKNEVGLYYLAESESAEVIRRAESFSEQGEPGRAVAICEAFPDSFKDTPYYGTVREKIPVYYAEYKEWKRADDEKEQTPWSDIAIDESLGDFSRRHKPGVDVWGGDDGVIKGNNATDSWAFLVAGEPEWLDYYIEFEVELGEGQDELIMGIHTIYDVRSKMQQFQLHRIAGIETEEWTKIRVESKGGRVRVLDLESGDELYSGRGKAYRGEYSFVLEAGQSIKVRNLRVKVLSQEEKRKEGEEEEDE